MRKTLLMTSCLLLTGTAAWATHPQPSPAGRVQAVAHQLEEATRHVYYQADYARHGYGRTDKWALKRLRKLEDRAERFHRQVERYRRDPYEIRHDYFELREAYYRAAEAVHSLHGSRHIRRDFERVSYLMRELEILIEGRRYDRRHDRRRVVPRYFYWQFRW